MCPEQINFLGLSAKKKTVKVSRRDFPYVLSQVNPKISFYTYIFLNTYATNKL